MSAYFSMTMPSPVGALQLIATNKHLIYLSWEAKSLNAIGGTPLQWDAKHPVLKQASTELQEYFDGSRSTFTVPIQLAGTPFQQSVWQALQSIPYGRTCSYAELAQMIRKPSACRAVGSANGCNPIAIIVPCHRVIAADQTLGGYGGGLEVKQRLLELEGCAIDNGAVKQAA